MMDVYGVIVGLPEKSFLPKKSSTCPKSGTLAQKAQGVTLPEKSAVLRIFVGKAPDWRNFRHQQASCALKGAF